MNKLPKFQPILPLVYDDSLSYYEQLGKITYTLNQLIDSVTYDGLAYKGELHAFWDVEPVPGYYSINVSDNPMVVDNFPEEFSGLGTLLILQGADYTYQATIIGADTNIYTCIYSDDAWGSWTEASSNKLIYRGQINQFNSSTVPFGKTGYWSVRNEGTTEDLPGNDAGTWTFGTLIVVQNGAYRFAFLTCSNGHTYTRYQGGTGDYADHWSNWRSDYGDLVELTDEYISSAVTLGTNGYLRYRQMGYEVFLDADLDSVAAPTDEVPIYVNVDSHIPHNANVAIQIPFVAGGGNIIGTCRVGATGQLSVERAYNLDTNTKITEGYIRWVHIHACYNIKA